MIECYCIIYYTCFLFKNNVIKQGFKVFWVTFSRGDAEGHGVKEQLIGAANEG